jgi:hypothetical protein
MALLSRSNLQPLTLAHLTKSPKEARWQIAVISNEKALALRLAKVGSKAAKAFEVSFEGKEISNYNGCK